MEFNELQYFRGFMFQFIKIFIIFSEMDIIF